MTVAANNPRPRNRVLVILLVVIDRVPAVAAGNVAPLDYDDKVGFALTYTDFLNKLADTTRNLQ